MRTLTRLKCKLIGRGWHAGTCLLAVFLTELPGNTLASDGLTALSLEQLMDVSIVSAAKFTQRVSKIASGVTVITRDEIVQHGWRSIADALRSVPGYYVHYDRAYEYVGARGFARPQDYNSRVLLLIDGYRTNDALYDQAYIGTDQLLDINLVERIEVVRGPGSSVYGGNAVFGVINIVTRTAAQIDGVELAGGLASHNTREGRATFGGRSENGVEVVASVSGMRSNGPHLYFPEFDAPQTNFGRTSGTDYDRNRRFFGRLSYDGLSLTAAASSRDKGAPTGAYGVNFNDPTNALGDSQAYVDLAYKRSLSPEAEASARLYWGDYAYDGPAHLGDPPVLNEDRAAARWWGGEIKLVSAWSPRNKVVGGIEFQKNSLQKQWNYDRDPYHLYFVDRRESQRLGIFIQDDFQWTESLNISLGARFDNSTGTSGEFTPRLGLVYRSSEQTVWKLQYGSAFRAPNAFERFYQFPGSQIANPNGLAPEKVATYEAGIEHYPGKQTRLAATAYYYNMKNLIEQATDPLSGLLQYVNVDTIKAHGLELEAEHQFDNAARLRINLDLLRTRNAHDEQLSNSPKIVAKFFGWLPLPWLGLQLGAEGQWLDSRKTDLGGTVSSYGIVNLTLLRPLAKDGWQFSASVYNLFDRRYDDPAAQDVAVASRDRFEQNGRTFRATAMYHF